ncbi:MAG: prephenate dehydrogenase/arogenate dehydrogenase family protein [Chloroflexota bacterium]
MKTQTITIIGLDLIGLSMGMALKKAPFEATIVGHDSDRDKLNAAKSLQAIDIEEWNLVTSIIKADIIILNVPISEVELTLEAMGEDVQAHTLILDLSPQKALPAKWAKSYLKRGYYVGALPVFSVGALQDGRSPEEVAHPDIFRNSVFCLMPTADVDPEAVETAVNVGLLVGALPFFIDPVEYDSLMQGVQFIPGLLSAALFGAVKESAGWRDILRYAARPFAMATQPLNRATESALLATQDKSATLRWLDAVIKELVQIRQFVAKGDGDLLQSILAERNLEREKWLKSREKNAWAEESKIKTVPVPGMADQIMGDYLAQRFKQSEEEK